jgi:hypothetical protein
VRAAAACCARARKPEGALSRRARALPLHCHAPVVPKSMLEKYGLLPGNAILAEEKHMALYQARTRARHARVAAARARRNIALRLLFGC